MVCFKSIIEMLDSSIRIVQYSASHPEVRLGFEVFSNDYYVLYVTDFTQSENSRIKKPAHSKMSRFLCILNATATWQLPIF